MNKFISVIFLIVFFTACAPQEDFFASNDEMNYVCSSLAKNYLKISQLESYELSHKTKLNTDTIQLSYRKSTGGSQVAFKPEPQSFECKKQHNQYVLNSIAPHSRQIQTLLTLNLHI